MYISDPTRLKIAEQVYVYRLIAKKYPGWAAYVKNIRLPEGIVVMETELVFGAVNRPHYFPLNHIALPMGCE